MVTTSAMITERVIARAEAFEGIVAGIADLEDVLRGPSYQMPPDTALSIGPSVRSPEKWIAEGRYLLVMGLHHPESRPEMDWFDRGNSPGNRILMEIGGVLIKWAKEACGLSAQLLPYFSEQGGIFLKDAAVTGGIGVVGRNNLLITKKWGPRVRLRAILLSGPLVVTPPLSDFFPCRDCGAMCHEVCPKDAFPAGSFTRSLCLEQLLCDKESRGSRNGGVSSEGNMDVPIMWCRQCELVCPIGEK